MNKEEFILWFNTHIGELSPAGEYQDIVDYGEYLCDYYSLNYNHKDITFTYDELYWGGSNTIIKVFSFEEFIERYNNDTLKN